MNESYVNNHIHTTYSFSPYSPEEAVKKAKASGLRSAGLMDHDSIAGAEEFLETGRILNLPVTIGVECRADFSSTRLNGRFINHPDQPSVAYVAIHGIPHNRFTATRDFFTPLIEARARRNAKMTDKINDALTPFDISIRYLEDVVPLSQYHRGGTVTERHLLYAVVLRLVEKFGKGSALITALENKLNIPITGKARQPLEDPANPFYDYDLLGTLKSGFGGSFYIAAQEECPPIKEIVGFANRIGAILAYAYLGDVAESVTGDKKAQHFEDAYLDLLFEEIARLKFQAVTYMPSRNTPAQLKRVRALCRRYHLLEISGEDINSPRQSFICPALSRPEFAHLVRMTWALIGHEQAATLDAAQGFFSEETRGRFPDIEARISHFQELAGVTA